MVARGEARRGGGAQAADGGESKERVQQRYSTALQGCRKRGAGGQWPSQILTDHLILFLPGGQIMPTTLLLVLPPDFQTLLWPCTVG